MASRRVMEKAGLKLARTFHQPWPYPIDGDQFGEVEYALDKSGWQQDIAAGSCPPTQGGRGGTAALAKSPG